MYPEKGAVMANSSEMDTIKESQSISSVIAELTGLPDRIDPAAFDTLITTVSTQIDGIEALKRQLTAAVNDKDANLKALRDQVVDIRGAVKGVFGADSNEYELVGGTRKSEHKRPGPRRAPQDA
jgi:hypothetical protein